jgi:hypothetical protein
MTINTTIPGMTSVAPTMAAPFEFGCHSFPSRSCSHANVRRRAEQLGGPWAFRTTTFDPPRGDP